MTTIAIAVSENVLRNVKRQQKKSLTKPAGFSLILFWTPTRPVLLFLLQWRCQNLRRCHAQTTKKLGLLNLSRPTKVCNDETTQIIRWWRMTLLLIVLMFKSCQKMTNQSCANVASVIWKAFCSQKLKLPARMLRLFYNLSVDMCFLIMCCAKRKCSSACIS